MKQLKLFFALFAMLALGVGNAWGETVSNTWDLTSSSSDWTNEGCVTYFSQPYGIKEKGAYIINKNISDFIKYSSTATNIKIGVKSLCNGATSSKLTVSLVDASGNVVGTGLEITPDNATAASKTTYKYVTFTSNFANIAGYKVECTTFGKNVLINGTSYEITYTPSSSGETPGEGGGEEPTPDPEEPTPGTSANVTYDFTQIDGFSSWGNSYSSHEVTYSDAKVTFEAASKQTSNITDCPVTKGKSVVLVMTDGSKLSSVKWVCKQWTTKTQTITLHYSTNGGGTYTRTGITSTNFSISSDNLPAGTNAVKITFNSTSNQVGISSCTITKVSSGSGETVVKTLQSIAVTDMKTTYEQGDIFKFNGICTATYSVTKDGVAQPDETVEVTPTSVSTPNMNTVGTQTITVTYETVSTTYDITITENEVTPGTYNVLLDNVLWNVASGQQAASVESMSGKANDITFYTTKGSSQMYANATQTRFYKDQTFTISVPEGYLIKSITFAEPASDKKWDGSITVNTGTYTDSTKTWTGSAQEVTYTFGAQNRIANAEITYEVAPVEPTKTLTSIEITTPATQTTFWQGETFNYNGLVVTAHYSDAADEVVTPTVTGSTATAGTATVNVSYKEQSTSYTITVKAIPNTKETAYSVADAYDIIDKLGTASGVFISGTISQVDSYSDQYKSITYWISADGTTTKQLQVYSGKGLESADFAALTDLSVGDQVIVCGNLKKYSGTYEFDKNNYLASHTPTTKDPAGLAYATTSYTANVGEAFTTPELTNPHNLVVTYSTSDASKATVDANTGAVTIVAAGVVTITATTTGDATHDAGSASYTITISNPAMAVATLPFTFNSGKADIENTAGMTQEGLGSDYSASNAPNSQLKFDGTGDWVVIRFDSEPGKLSYDIKNNSFSGGTFSVQESADGETYTDVKVHTEITDLQSEEYELNSASRYVKFIYTTKSSGNVGLGNIKITKFGEEPEQPGEGGGEGTEQPLTDWVLTSAADITIKDLVVITMTKLETTWAMTNNNGTNAAPVASKVTVTANALAAEPDANLKWVVSNDNGTLTIYPYGDDETWLYCTNTNNGVRVGTGEAKEFTIDTDHLYTTLTNDPRYLGVYDADADTWCCYTSINSNIEGQTLAFYVKKNANDVLPGTGEDPEEPGDDPVVPTPTVNPTATFIFNTAEGLDELSIAYPTTPTTTTDGTTDAFKTEFANNASFTKDGITMTTTGGTTVATRVWLTKNGALDLRVYKGATLTFSVPAEHQISTIVFDGSNIDHLLVNGTAVSGNAWTGSAQTITFTAKDDAKTIKINTIAFVVEYTRNVTNKYGTICLPYASASTSGAYFYEVVGKGTENGKSAVYLASVDALKAGVPYIFEKTANTIKVVYSSEKADTPQKANGLIGNFTNEYVVPVDNYILYKNAFIPADGTTNKVNAYRAYLNLSVVEGGKPNHMPGRRYIGMDVQGENVETGVEDLFTTDAPVKVIENGQLIIIRDGVKYNVQGQKL
ncbi:MAG: bacterial Ig-like domain-containing protein [Paludibacteraceae bacterium]|nr:bacterial Ig-like domain-containing protein [Paludibacteraceae bacterium]